MLITEFTPPPLGLCLRTCSNWNADLLYSLFKVSPQNSLTFKDYGSSLAQHYGFQNLSTLSSPFFNMAHIRNIYSFSLLTLQLRALITRSTIVGSDYKEGKTRSLKVGSSTILGLKMEKSQNYPKTFQPCPWFSQPTIEKKNGKLVWGGFSHENQFP